MFKFGVPLAAVRQKMQTEGIDPVGIEVIFLR
jgi:Predicted coiled-coil domain-containing protein (DUF2360).